MSDFNIKEFADKHRLTREDIAKIVSSSIHSVNSWFAGSRNFPKSKEKLLLQSVKHNVQDMVQESAAPYPAEGRLINNENLPTKDVLVIPIKGRGGLENTYYDDFALNSLDVEKLNIKYPSSKGSKWFKIEVEGVSMDDSTKDSDGSKYSLCEGDWAYCRSIPKAHWRDKLHFNKVKVFCFFHNTKGILFKNVINHDSETGVLTLSSFNPDKKTFPDFNINVAECSYICNVIKVLSEF